MRPGSRARAVHSRRPLLVFLHGRGRDGQESNANGAFFDALDKLGARAPAVVFPSGGEALGIEMRHWSGKHEGDCWRAHFARDLRFYADALAAC